MNKHKLKKRYSNEDENRLDKHGMESLSKGKFPQKNAINLIENNRKVWN